MRRLILFRGAQGAGKTTIANALCNNKVFEADDYFTNERGEYNFDEKLLSKAHIDCVNRVKNEIALNSHNADHTVAVANTFSQIWEMQPYFYLANNNGYQIVTLIVENRHMSRSIRDVPKSKVEKCRIRFDVWL